jgi:hypothetical protein
VKIVQRALAPMALLALPLCPLLAQEGGSVWVLDEARGGFCVWYLTDPELAPAFLPKGGVARTAAHVEGLPPMLQRVVQDEPRFQEWVPAVLCIGRYASVQVDGRQMDRAKDADRPVLVTWQAIAAESPLEVNGAGWLLTHLGGDAPMLERAAGNSTVAFRGRELRNDRIQGAETGDDAEDAWEFRVDGVKLFWSGRQIGEMRVGETRTMSFGYAGARATNWAVEIESTPGHERTAIGSLRVEGKNDLAKAMKGSPVRAIGPAELGGRTTVTFRRPGR